MRAASCKRGWSGRRARSREAVKQGGFTYLALLAAVAIIGVTLAAAGEVWHTAQRREKEQELLFIGDQFRRAIGLYYDHSPGNGRYPASLEDLLKDPRYPSTQRYLRKIYRDPINGGTEWGFLRKPNGGIYGVFSLSEDEPIKKSNFRYSDRDFAGKSKYAEWIFVHVPNEKNSANLPQAR